MICIHQPTGLYVRIIKTDHRQNFVNALGEKRSVVTQTEYRTEAGQPAIPASSDDSAILCSDNLSKIGVSFEVATTSSTVVVVCIEE